MNTHVLYPYLEMKHIFKGFIFLEIDVFSPVEIIEGKI